MALIGEMKKLTVGSKTYSITVPTKTSDLTNDSGYITSSAIANKANLSNGYVDDTELLSAATIAKWQAILS